MADLFNLSRLGIGVNLPTNATYDILLVNTPAFPVGAVTFSYSVPTSSKITGIQKCAQMFLKTLLTSKGSDLLNPAYGTNLPGLVIGGNSTLNYQELVSTVTTAIQDAITQTQAITNDTINDPASMLQSVVVLDISLNALDSFSLALQLTTLAGEVGNISLPTPLLSTAVYNG